MSQYFRPYDSSIGNIKVELDLVNYATKVLHTSKILHTLT